MVAPNQPQPADDIASLSERLAIAEKREERRIEDLIDYFMNDDETLSREDAEIRVEALNLLHSINAPGSPYPKITLEDAEQLIKTNRQEEREEMEGREAKKLERDPEQAKLWAETVSKMKESVQSARNNVSETLTPETDEKRIEEGEVPYAA